MASALCPVSSTDRVPDSESVDRGSIPLRDTKRKMHPLWGVHLFFVHFSGGSEDGSPRNKKPPAMPVRLSVFRSKQKNYLNVV